jgi:threonylcarbamoyladenosine tRNA methylthiotransferase MtaB
MFARSLALIDDCGLTQLHVFPFSPRPGTPAARMPQLDREVAKDRARRLRDKGEAALAAQLSRQVGARRSVLVEMGNVGHTAQFLPVKLAQPTAPGIILDLTIAGHDGRRLLAA